MYSGCIEILVVGDSSVGKTSLIRRFLNLRRNRNLPAVELEINSPASVSTRRMDRYNDDGMWYALTIWENPGQPHFDTATRNFYKNAVGSGIILVYDVNNRETFDNLEAWYNLLQFHFSRLNMPKILIGNKTDQVGRRQISRQDGIAYATSHGMLYLEMSAIRNDDLDAEQGQAFQALVNNIIESRTQLETRSQSQGQSHAHANRSFNLNANSNIDAPGHGNINTNANINCCIS